MEPAQIRRASEACTNCRGRHIKCNGEKPTCDRCQIDRVRCVYVPSRRGGRRRAAKTQNADADQQSTPGALQLDPGAVDSLPTPMSNELATNPSNYSSPESSFEFGNELQFSEPLINLYYEFFHPAHPCVLPWIFLQPYRDSNISGIEPLLAVMQYLGSLYTDKVDSKPWKQQAVERLNSSVQGISLFDIQALLLYAIAAQWTNEQANSDKALNLTIDFAINMQIYSKSFAMQYEVSSRVMEESCIRTWWQLYISDMAMAAISHRTDFRLSQIHVQHDVDLPCFDAEYESGQMPKPRTLEEYDEREFGEVDDTGFSSFAYFIGLYRILDVIITGKLRRDEEVVKRICITSDAAIASFRNFCKKTKRGMMIDDRTVDHFIWEAEMSIVVYTADVHRYLSTIVYHPIESRSSCGPPPPPEKLAPAYLHDAPIHTAKILEATEHLIRLLTLPVDLLKHSPFTICKIATPTIALLSACKNILQGEHLIAARERIRAVFAALDKYAEIWPRGAKTLDDIKCIATVILGISKPTARSTAGPVMPIDPAMSIEPQLLANSLLGHQPVQNQGYVQMQPDMSSIYNSNFNFIQDMQNGPHTDLSSFRFLGPSHFTSIQRLSVDEQIEGLIGQGNSAYSAGHGIQ